MKSNDLFGYAMDFASFLIQNVKEKDEIKSIILFGSIAREDFGIGSDVDIFVDTKSKNIESEATKILENFYKSVKYTKYWKLLGIKHEISLKVGDLEQWDLKGSIISHGIVLYGKYLSDTKTKPFAVFLLEIKGERKDKIKVWRHLYGYKQRANKKIYENKGLIDKYGGRRLGRAIFIVPIEHRTAVIKFLKKNNVQHEVFNMWMER